MPLVDHGIIDEVIRPLMSGKEAQIYLVQAKGERRVAKVYKEASQRSFKHRADYTEGRRGRNSRSQRAVARRSSFGRAESEAAWRSAEVEAMERLSAAGVRVPRLHDFFEGVLVMELVADEEGQPAPRIVDLQLSRAQAEDLFGLLLREVVKMLCVGVVHGDLSDFNVLMGTEGPVIIDFPQVVDPAFNRNARKLLLRDVHNLQHFLSRFSHGLRHRQFGEEMWALYEQGRLRPDTRLTGRWRKPTRKADADRLLEEFMELERESLARREALGLGPPRPARRPTPREPEAGPGAKPSGTSSGAGPDKPRRKRRRRRRKPKTTGS